jgi:TPP-dependent pyruvate/acetoin dehydrogenase alpha subunit
MAASKSRPPTVPPRLAVPGVAGPSSVPALPPPAAARPSNGVQQGLPRIRAGVAAIAGASFVEVWSDEAYQRATGLERVLDAEGRVDGGGRGGVPPLEAVAMRDVYRSMLRIGALDARARRREAAIVGAAAAMRADDPIFPGAYAPGVAVYRGLSVEAAASGDTALPRALHVLPASPFRATQLPQATGYAWAAKMQSTPQRKPIVALAYLDVPATSAEDFHTGLNFAGVYRVPVVFVCVSDARLVAAPETVSETIAVKALAYGIAADRVDGGDFLAVYRAVTSAAERARRGEGATLIEAVVDVRDEAPDPLRRLGAWLAAEKIVDEPAARAMRGEVEHEVEQAAARRPPVVADLDT